MSKKNKTKERILMVIFMFIVTTVFVSIISAVHISTKDIVKRNESLFLKSSVLYTAGVETPQDPEKIEETFKSSVKTTTITPPFKYEVKSKKGIITVKTVSGSGLWGEIIAHVGFYNDGTISGISFIKQSETPGLGARIDESWFKEQFRGKKGPMTFVPEGKSEKDTEFDAITGATVTTTAVKNIVNSTLKNKE